MIKLADEIWTAIQRTSPSVSKSEIEKMIAAHVASLVRPHGSVITLNDVEDNVVKVPAEGWALDHRSFCYRPILNMQGEVD